MCMHPSRNVQMFFCEERLGRARVLSAWELARLHHCCVLLLESLSYPLSAFHELIHTSHHTTFLSRNQGLGGEIVDTVVEASLDESGIHLHELLHLLGLHPRVELSLFRGGESVHDCSCWKEKSNIAMPKDRCNRRRNPVSSS